MGWSRIGEDNAVFRNATDEAAMHQLAMDSKLSAGVAQGPAKQHEVSPSARDVCFSRFPPIKKSSRGEGVRHSYVVVLFSKLSASRLIFG